MLRRTRPVWLLLAGALLAGPAAAQPPVAPEPEAPAPEGEPAQEPELDEATKRGLAAYNRGVELVRQQQWGDALEAFEEAAAARDAPFVQYNIVVCQRALGRYVAARRTARSMLKDPTGLPASHIQDLEAYVAEFERLIVHLEVEMTPPGALLSVDGRPLAKDGNVWLAGIAAGKVGTDPKARRFSVLLDPGWHVIVARREGHRDVVVQKSYRPGQKAKLALRLDEMPATVVVKSRPKDAIVRVDEREVGVAPVEFERPAGSYRLEVVKDEYTTYTAALELSPGQRAELTAELSPYEPPLYERWWLWVSIGGAVATGVVTAVVATRPEPEPPPFQTGSTGWLVDPQPAAAPLVRW